MSEKEYIKCNPFIEMIIALSIIRGIPGNVARERYDKNWVKE